jgi:hypothetical protein
MSFLLAGRAYRNLTTVRQTALRLIWWLQSKFERGLGSPETRHEMTDYTIKT